MDKVVGTKSRRGGDEQEREIEKKRRGRNEEEEKRRIEGGLREILPKMCDPWIWVKVLATSNKKRRG
jgi:hypothetical protein